MSVFFPGNIDLLDPAGLQANQRGEITEVQDQRLNGMVGWLQGCITLVVVVIFIPILLSFTYLFARLFEIDIPYALLASGVVLLLALAFMGRAVWKVWESFAMLRRDRENRAIRQAQGQLSYRGNRYVFQADERTLTLPASKNAGGLLPGASYRVYYLEESGFVLSAEERAPASPAQVRTALGDILAGANGFSLEELAGNRSGLVTARQRGKVFPQIFLGALFGIAGIVLFLPMVWISVLIAVVFLLIGGFMAVNALLDLTVSAPQQAQGPGHKETRMSGGRRRRRRYYYVVGDWRFEVNSAAYAALIDGLQYRAYYLPRTKQLISIEPLDGVPDAPQVNYNPF